MLDISTKSALHISSGMLANTLRLGKFFIAGLFSSVLKVEMASLLKFILLYA
jgi:hypothetical protein